MLWTLRADKRVEKKLRRLTPKDQRLIREALVALRDDPYRAKLQSLRHQPTGYRLEVGNWRLPLDIYADQLLIYVADLVRRTTTTYRKRH